MTKSRGTRLKLICNGPELKTLCHYYFHINVIIQQNVLIYYYSGLDAHDCECRNGEHLGMSMNKAVVDRCYIKIVRSHTQFSCIHHRI